MRMLEDIRAKMQVADMLRGQAQHVMLGVLLTVGALAMLHDTSHSLLGLRSVQWAQITIAAAILHQVLVVLVWRTQLYFAWMTRAFGRRALAIWGAMFLPFLFARPVLILATGLADPGSLPGARALQIGLGCALLIPAIWGAHSVVRYFTVPRALGGDHFFDEYLNLPLVREGLFKYSQNAMYGIIFLGLWGLALLTGSWNALVVALFQHAYIWVHMYCTEAPDMALLYKDG